MRGVCVCVCCIVYWHQIATASVAASATLAVCVQVVLSVLAWLWSSAACHMVLLHLSAAVGIARSLRQAATWRLQAHAQPSCRFVFVCIFVGHPPVWLLSAFRVALCVGLH